MNRSERLVRLFWFYKKRAKKRMRRRLYLKWKLRNFRWAEQGLPRKSKELHRIREQRKYNYKNVIAPEDFSFLENTEAMLEFIGKLSACWDLRVPVWVVLKKVRKIDYGGIVVLLSVMLRFKAMRTRFNGDFPEDEAVQGVLMASGFFEQLELEVKNTSKYKVTKAEGIVTHANKKVDSVLSHSIIRESSKHIWGRPMRCQGAQRVILELTQNTNNHASPVGRGDKHWFLSVCKIPGEKRVTFSLVDYGVGIFKSLHSKQEGERFFGVIKKLWERIGDGLRYDDAILLQKILEGELHRTASGKYFRGKGLPGVRHTLDMNAIARLNIITNSVKANVSDGKFELLKNNFQGTFIYWELNESVAHCLEDET